MVSETKAMVNNYRLLHHQQRLDRGKSSPDVKSLRDEVVILRIVMEEHLNKCKTTEEFLMYAGRIQTLAVDIGKVLQQCHTLEEKTGFVIDKSKVLKIADGISDVIQKYIPDKATQDTISQEIILQIIAISDPAG